MRLLDTHVGISSFVGTRTREGHVLVTSFVNNETADWKYKRDKMVAKVFRVAGVEASNKFLTLTLVSLLPEAPETKVYILSVVRSANVLSFSRRCSRWQRKLTVVHYPFDSKMEMKIFFRNE